MRYILVTWIEDSDSPTVYERVGKHVFIIREYGGECLRHTNFMNLEDVRNCAKENWHCDFIHDFDDIEDLDKIFMMVELMK